MWESLGDIARVLESLRMFWKVFEEFGRVREVLGEGGFP